MSDEPQREIDITLKPDITPEQLEALLVFLKTSPSVQSVELYYGDDDV